jgi:hypothetical protein
MKSRPGRRPGMKYKIVEVTWVDAEESGDIGWNNLKAQLKYAKKPCPVMRSVGYEVYRSAEHIALLSSVGDKDCSTLEKIPMSFVTSVVTLTGDKVSE